MSREMLDRMRTVGEYQRKAVRALLPEKVNGHLDVIEQEIRVMLLELAEEAVNRCKEKETGEEERDGGKMSRTKRVDIL